MTIPTFNKINIFLVSLIILLSILAYYQAVKNTPQGHATSHKSKTEMVFKEVIQLQRPLPESTFSAIENTPLFFRERRPYQKSKAKKKQKPALKKPEIKLIGIISQNNEKSAIVRTVKAGRYINVSVGDKIQNWTVKDISDLQITLESEKKVIDFQILLPPPLPKVEEASGISN